MPLAAGTGLDIIARFYGERLAQSLGKPVVIENRPGAGMIPATQAALAAPPDGHTLLVATSSTLSINQTLFKQLPYDPEKDLVPIAHYITAPFILADQSVAAGAAPSRSSSNTPRSSPTR